MPLSRRSLMSSAAAAAVLPFAAAAATGGGSVVPGAAEARAPGLPKVGAPLALADVVLLDGSRFTPASADGKLLVLYWWASWCPFCAVQSPYVEALWQAQRARGLSVLALSIDRDAKTALNYIRQKNYSFPAGMLTPEVARTMPKPKGLPVTVVRGRDGRVVLAEAGEMFPEDIEGIAKFL
jgi:hypothetical protein